MIDPSQQDPIRVNSLATTNARLIRSGKCCLQSLLVSNNGAGAAFLKLFDKATVPVPGTDVPILIVPIPASSIVSLPIGDVGPSFELGLGISITNLVADADTTAVAANQVKVLGGYCAL